MATAYPDLANPYTLWVGAYDLLGHPSLTGPVHGTPLTE
jgi:hypothetical protein